LVAVGALHSIRVEGAERPAANSPAGKHPTAATVRRGQWRKCCQRRRWRGKMTEKVREKTLILRGTCMGPGSRDAGRRHMLDRFARDWHLSRTLEKNPLESSQGCTGLAWRWGKERVKIRTEETGKGRWTSVQGGGLLKYKSIGVWTRQHKFDETEPPKAVKMSQSSEPLNARPVKSRWAAPRRQTISREERPLPRKQ